MVKHVSFISVWKSCVHVNGWFERYLNRLQIPL